MNNKMTRPSKRGEIETILGKNIWTIFADMPNVTTLAEARDEILKRTMRINVYPGTIQFWIETGKDNGEIQDGHHCLSWIPVKSDESVKKGLPSTREKVELKIGGSIFALFEKQFQNIDDAEGACALLTARTDISCTPKTLIKMLEKAVEANEVQPDAFFLKWIPAPKRHRRTSEEVQAEQQEKKSSKHGDKSTHKHIASSDGHTILSTQTCSNCSYKKNNQPDVYFGKEYLLGLKGRYCPQCTGGSAKIHSIIAEFSAQGKQVRKTVVPVITALGHEVLAEEFVDKDNNKIENPFL